MLYMVRYRHRKWDLGEYEYQWFTDYPMAKLGYTKLIAYDFYVEVDLFKCERVMTMGRM